MADRGSPLSALPGAFGRLSTAHNLWSGLGPYWPSLVSDFSVLHRSVHRLPPATQHAPARTTHTRTHRRALTDTPRTEEPPRGKHEMSTTHAAKPPPSLFGDISVVSVHCRTCDRLLAPLLAVISAPAVPLPALVGTWCWRCRGSERGKGAEPGSLSLAPDSANDRTTPSPVSARARSRRS